MEMPGETEFNHRAKGDCRATPGVRNAECDRERPRFIPLHDSGIGNLFGQVRCLVFHLRRSRRFLPSGTTLRNNSSRPTAEGAVRGDGRGDLP